MLVLSGAAGSCYQGPNYRVIRDRPSCQAIESKHRFRRLIRLNSLTSSFLTESFLTQEASEERGEWAQHISSLCEPSGHSAPILTFEGSIGAWASSPVDQQENPLRKRSGPPRRRFKRPARPGHQILSQNRPVTLQRPIARDEVRSAPKRAHSFCPSNPSPSLSPCSAAPRRPLRGAQKRGLASACARRCAGLVGTKGVLTALRADLPACGASNKGLNLHHYGVP
jgi:hypothetical protein